MATRAPACAASELVDKGRESAAVLHALLVGQQPAVGAVATPRSLRELTGGGTRKRKPERGYGPAPPPATSSKRTRLNAS
ncbi:putative WRKY transcription factor 70 [Panicum miliaceum]|uniref:WRKY transcription factor 70 n=1 Tax=Panicum miliaceum TaxID=4540 RepID=A0A3L6T139_PANMI|nr:putative WRKY transcription factor 70 [Panicum miliaceum]